ncbi:MAG TPA: stage II sporulation protein M [Acidimicrobiales bacterium]|nr:stage II sporulation protein M [Acidimicrobiales bacterium]
MDLDRYIATHQSGWERLGTLSDRARRSIRSLSPAELDEMLGLYHRTSAHLSHARAQYADPALTRRLTALVAKANVAVYGTKARSWRAFTTFFSHSFPAAVWQSRRFVLAAFVLTFLPAIVIALWIANSDAALEASAPDAVRQAYVEQNFEEYYKSSPSAQFATEVTVNNIRVAFLAFAGGILFCVGTAYILVSNGANVGYIAGWFVVADAQPFFYGLILPHGLLELTAVVIAGASGLRLGWAVIAPGDRTRGQSVAEEGKRAAVIVLGLVLVFIVAGTIEGFVTGSALPTFARVGIGLSVELAFVSYVVVRGREATAQGWTGEMGEHLRLVKR